MRWRTDVAVDSRVSYGAAPGSLVNQVDDPTSTTEHEVLLTGLSADTQYSYAIGTTSQILAGDDAEHFFVTSPVPGTEKPLQVWVLGDSGLVNNNARAVRDAYLGFTGSRYTDVWLMLGDNAYNSGTDSEYQAAVFDQHSGLLRQTPLWSTLGNHDGASADSATQTGVYYDSFTFPKSAQAGGLASGTEAYYSFDYANIHFVCLDSHDSDRSPGGAMLTWLENDLAETTQKWIIAFWHHPPYSKGSHNSDTESQLIQMRENALPILESYGVDLVMGGHSHAYERSFLVDGHYGTSSTLTNQMRVDDGDGQEDGNGAYIKESKGAIYIVAGSSAQATGGSLNHPVMHVSLNQLGSLVLNIDGDRLDATFLDDVGLIQDYLTIVKPSAGNQAPSVAAGGDQTIILPTTASLNGTVSDDGLPDPPSTVTTAWIQVGGPGSVTLVNATMVNATASFPVEGTYVLQLTAN
ncbi:MAG: metallophosphoesterase, partial [Gemmatimonadales bacterium]